MAARNGNGATATAPAPAQQTEGVPAQRTSTQPQRLASMLEKSMEKLAAALPKHLTPERLIQVVSAVNYRTPKLQECDPATIVAAVLQGAALGLDFSPTMGEAYLIPRWNDKIKRNECQFQPGYRGLMKLSRNSGGVTSIRAELVYSQDTFVYEYNPDLYFRHAPYPGDNRGKVTHAYAVARTTDGEHLIQVMRADEIEAIHQRSDNFKSARKNGKPEFGPWVSDWGEMAKKTVLKRLCKHLPMSVELAQAIDADNTEYTEAVAQIAPTPRGMAGLSAQLGIEEALLPPQPTRTYTEADEGQDEPAIDVEHELVQEPAPPPTFEAVARGAADRTGKAFADVLYKLVDAALTSKRLAVPPKGRPETLKALAQIHSADPEWIAGELSKIKPAEASPDNEDTINEDDPDRP